MRKSLPYKYINLLFRFVVGIVAVCFIYEKLKADFFNNLGSIDNGQIKWSFLLATILFMFVNWGIEALKWKYAIRAIHQIKFIRAIRLTFTGITVGLLTPNRIGEIPIRAALLKSNSFKEVVLKTVASSFSQVIITFLMGGIGLMFTHNYFYLGLNSILINAFILFGLLVLFALYFNIQKLAPIFKKVKILRNEKLIESLMDINYNELLILLLFSLMRYLIFFLQYWLLLDAFGVELATFTEILLIPVCFLFASSIPTILISEIGVRGSVALFVFGVVSGLDIQIVIVSVLLWLINVAFPAILGLYDLKALKLFKEK